jgi:Zn-finger nucleic acid-binding protein
MVKYCPSCKTELTDSSKLAQGCKKCDKCGGVYYIIETTIPEKERQKNK